MRTLKLTHEEIRLIETALLYVYDRKLDNIKLFSQIMSKDEYKHVLENANDYSDLQDQISNSEKDV